ncbi:hypothetical protein FQA47_023724 [Oryzias melastigma]|uniref:Uncharacterized protein n=1 Tax=Oryzias melastigma TaxID=30732 RepID=A0A834FPI5_ORYME|nr:hypothetical protein FQA47_023724 [Oryzias melastigma]
MQASTPVCCSSHFATRLRRLTHRFDLRTGQARAWCLEADSDTVRTTVSRRLMCHIQRATMDASHHQSGTMQETESIHKSRTKCRRSRKAGCRWCKTCKKEKKVK